MAAAQEAVWLGHIRAAESAFRTQDFPKAEAEVAAAVKVGEVFGEKDERFAASLGKQLQIYAVQRKYSDAIGPAKRLVAVRETAYGADHFLVGAALNDLAGLHKDLEKNDEASPLYERALAIGEKAGDSGARLVAIVLNNLAEIYRDQKKLDEAETAVARSLALREKLYGQRHDAYADGLRTFATIHAARGKHAEAETLYRQVLAIRRRRQIWNRPVMMEAMVGVAGACAAQDKNETAETFYKAALRTGEGGLGRNDDIRADAFEQYADLLKKLKRDAEASQMAEQARIIRSRMAGSGVTPPSVSK